MRGFGEYFKLEDNFFYGAILLNSDLVSLANSDVCKWMDYCFVQGDLIVGYRFFVRQERYV